MALYGDEGMQFESATLCESIERLIRSLLRDNNFALDDESTRGLTVFTNGAWDLEQGRLVSLSPDIRSTRCTGYDLEPEKARA